MFLKEIENVLDKKDLQLLKKNMWLSCLMRVNPFMECFLRENGNYKILILEDGTKIRFNHEKELRPEMPECIDMTVSTRCDIGCEFCYLGCGKDGKDAKFDWELMDQIPMYTELAINVNSITQEGLEEFLIHMSERKVLVNITVNSKLIADDKSFKFINEWLAKKYIRGVGISINKYDKHVVKKINALNYRYHNCCVIQCIAGVVDLMNWAALLWSGVGVLILGYKNIGRGKKYHDEKVDKNIRDLRCGIKLYYDAMKNDEYFRAPLIAFDGLSIKQLGIHDILTDAEFDSLYSGNEGAYTFYYNAVDDTYAVSSISEDHVPRNGKTIKEVFQSVQTDWLRED